MDNSTKPLAAKNDDNLDVSNLKSKEVAKSVDHSPARSSVKNFKTSNDPKVSGNKLPTKPESKSVMNLPKCGNLKNNIAHCRRSSASPVTTKSPSSSTLPEKSRIPTMKKAPFNNSNTKLKTVAPAKTPAVQPNQPKSPPKEVLAEKKRPDLKQNLPTRSNSKASISKLESLQAKRMATSISKTNFAMPASNVNQVKRTAKCQSARANSESPPSCKNKRSASNISTRSTPCPPRKIDYETNLNKKLSTAGDQNTEATVKTDLTATPNVVLEKKVKESKSPESLDDFRCKIKSFVDVWSSSLKNQLKDVDEPSEKVEPVQLFKLIDDWSFKNMSSIDEFKKEIEVANESFRQLEKKYNDLVKQYEEEKENDLSNLAKKDENIKEFQKKTKSLEKQNSTLKTTVQNLEKEKENHQCERDHIEEELKTCRENNTATNKKLHDSEQQLKHEKRDVKTKIEIIKKLENDVIDKKKLETDLAEMTTKLETLQAKLSKKTHNECAEHAKQIAELESVVNALEMEKESLQQENEKLRQDLENVHEKLLEAEEKAQELQATLEEKENSAETIPDYSKEVQMEFAKFRQADAEKRREIDKLKIELSKCQFNICQLEQQVQRDQQLLEVRSGLINSLQTNEKTHRIHMEELFAQVGEKNNAINELNCELQTKSEEFRNLYTTLSAKQIEVANQEHIIKLLEESNERSQMLRVKQEEKIGRLEEELAHLKQTISIYHDNVLAGNSGRHLLYNPVLPPRNMENNENFYYYVSQRKRKRQVDINVKKYEA